jgi:uncharacterized membrane protein YphA (DoxX/SURF4 family)
MIRIARIPRTDRYAHWAAAFSTAYRRRETDVLRISVGVLFVWFGALKFVPALSPAQDIATQVMGVISFGMVPPGVSQPALALMEVLIGIGLVTGKLLRLTLAVFFVHMGGVFATLVILPGAVWQYPFVPSMEGQYIIKNLVLVTACLSVAAAALRTARSSSDATQPDALPRTPDVVTAPQSFCPSCLLTDGADRSPRPTPAAQGSVPSGAAGLRQDPYLVRHSVLDDSLQPGRRG